MTYELEIMVAGGRATARLKTPDFTDARRGVEDIDLNPLE